MSNSLIQKLYLTWAPKWVVKTPWLRKWNSDKKDFYRIFGIFLAMLYTDHKMVSYREQIGISRPQSEEERLHIEGTLHSKYAYNWLPGQYEFDAPPMYDLAVRRKNYPEHYGKRYDGFKRYNV